MDVTMIGLQNAGKTSLLRVLSVSPPLLSWVSPHGPDEINPRAENSPSSKRNPSPLNRLRLSSRRCSLLFEASSSSWYRLQL